MTSVGGAELLSPEDAEESLTRDEVFSTLSNRRRRLVLHYLKTIEGEATIRDLATQVAAWENDCPIDALTRKERKRVYTALHQSHLPKMDDLEVVEYDSNRGTVRLAEAMADLDIYLEIVPEGEFTWSEYYLGLSTVLVALLVAAWLGLLPLSLPDVVYGLVAVLAVLVSSVVHYLSARRRRLGAGGVDADE